MQLRKPPAALVPLPLLALCACGPEDDGALIPMRATLEAGMASEGFRYGESARWTEDIPPGIPPLRGEMRVGKVVPGQQYRIGDSASTQEAIAQYPAQLEALGFRLDDFVYTADSIPDEQTAARIARGEWDTVDITQCLYRMRLVPGETCARLDIDSADFIPPAPALQITPTPLIWPAEIPARAPQPASCQMPSLAELGGEYAGGYQTTFDCADPLVQGRFVEVLLAAGFTRTDRLVSDTGHNVPITLGDGGVTMEAAQVVGTNSTITVWPADGLTGTPSVWPAVTRGSLPMATPTVPAATIPDALPTAMPVAWPGDIPGRIPRPPACAVFYVGALESSGYRIGLDCPEHGLHAHFVEALLGAGQTETQRAVSTAGGMVALTQQGAEIDVDGFPHPGSGYSIQVQPLTP